MIRFSEFSNKSEYLETTKTSNFKEIKPVLKTTETKVNDFWNNVFKKGNDGDISRFTDEEIISEIFTCDENDFSFDVDINDRNIQERLLEFETERWDNSNELEKIEIIEKFKKTLCEKLGVKEEPELTLFEDEQYNCGCYDSRNNTLQINKNIFNDPKEVVDTIAHEIRHAYQYQRANIGETRMDNLYAYNFLNYVNPIQIDGYYVNFNEYQNQLLEAEARAFARMFNN